MNTIDPSDAFCEERDISELMSLGYSRRSAIEICQANTLNQQPAASIQDDQIRTVSKNANELENAVVDNSPKFSGSNFRSVDKGRQQSLSSFVQHVQGSQHLTQLLAEQKARYGANMKECLTSHDLIEVSSLVQSLGCSDTDARLMVFEDRYVPALIAGMNDQLSNASNPADPGAEEVKPAVRTLSRPFTSLRRMFSKSSNKTTKPEPSSAVASSSPPTATLLSTNNGSRPNSRPTSTSNTILNNLTLNMPARGASATSSQDSNDETRFQNSRRSSFTQQSANQPNQSPYQSSPYDSGDRGFNRGFDNSRSGHINNPHDYAQSGEDADESAFRIALERSMLETSRHNHRNNALSRYTSHRFETQQQFPSDTFQGRGDRRENMEPNYRMRHNAQQMPRNESVHNNGRHSFGHRRTGQTNSSHTRPTTSDHVSAGSHSADSADSDHLQFRLIHRHPVDREVQPQAKSAAQLDDEALNLALQLSYDESKKNSFAVRRTEPPLISPTHIAHNHSGSNNSSNSNSNNNSAYGQSSLMYQQQQLLFKARSEPMMRNTTLNHSPGATTNTTGTTSHATHTKDSFTKDTHNNAALANTEGNVHSKSNNLVSSNGNATSRLIDSNEKLVHNYHNAKDRYLQRRDQQQQQNNNVIAVTNTFVPMNNSKHFAALMVDDGTDKAEQAMNAMQLDDFYECEQVSSPVISRQNSGSGGNSPFLSAENSRVNSANNSFVKHHSGGQLLSSANSNNNSNNNSSVDLSPSVRPPIYPKNRLVRVASPIRTSEDFFHELAVEVADENEEEEKSRD